MEQPEISYRFTIYNHLLSQNQLQEYLKSFYSPNFSKNLLLTKIFFYLRQ